MSSIFRIGFALSISSERWGRAVIESSVAVASFVVALGGFFLSFDAKHQRDSVCVAMLAHLNSGRESQFISLTRSIDVKGLGGFETQLHVHTVSPNGDDCRNLCPQLRPLSFTLDRASETVFVGTQEGAIYSIDLTDPLHPTRLLGRHNHHAPHEMSCSKDGTTLVTNDIDDLYVWDLNQRRLKWCKLRTSCKSFAVAPNGRSILGQREVAGTFELVEYDLEEGGILDVVDCNVGPAVRLDFSPNGRYLVSTGLGGAISLYERKSGERGWQVILEPQLGASVSAVTAFAETSNRLATVHPDGEQMVVWDLDQKRVLCTLGSKGFNAVGATFLPNGHLVTWSATSDVKVWDIHTQLMLHQLTLKCLPVDPV